MTTQRLSELNQEQQRAVTTTEGPLLVLAGAGSGKTRVVTCRIAYLLEKGILPSQILGLTFTNKAAGEMKERVRLQTNSDVLICTFHSLGAKILRESIETVGYKKDFTIYDEDDVEKLLKLCLEELFSERKLDVKKIRSLISEAKNSGLLPEAAESSRLSPEGMVFPEVYARYQEKLKASNSVDFDDLLFLTLRLFKEHPDILHHYQDRWKYLLVDEYQDTNAVQYTIIRYLTAKSCNLCVVGDPDQSIYSWRGANVRNILEFESDFPGAAVVRLERNYRSSSNILNAANHLISKNTGRYKKNLWSDLGPGEKIKQRRCFDEKEEASYVVQKILFHREKDDIPLSQMVVFYRTNAQSRVLEDYFLQKRIPYVIVGGMSFYQRREVKDILAFLRMVFNGTDVVSFLRTISTPKRGLGSASLEKIYAASLQEGMSIFSYVEALVFERPLGTKLSLGAKQKKALKDYVQTILDLRAAFQASGLSEAVKQCIEATGYLDYLKEDKATYEDRLGNLEALVTKAADFEAASQPENLLGAFLEELSLKSTLDETAKDGQQVHLMTMHNGKGLEFKVTFLIGIEEDLFPHINSKDSNDLLEEERRLCYVGMTRARQHLYLTHCQSRRIWGMTRSQRPSRFLSEIPFQYVEKQGGGYGFSRPQEDVFQEDPLQNERCQTTEPDPVDVASTLFSPGDTIFHQTFGIGSIKEVADSGIGPMYRIFFTKSGEIKTLLASRANLKKLD